MSEVTYFVALPFVATDDGIAAGEAYGLRRLYVALTRAVSRLTILHAELIPAELCSVP